MKKQFKLLSALALVALAYTTQAQAMGGTSVNVKAIIGVQTCLGGGDCNQSQSLNAIGDAFNADVKTATFIDLGKVGATSVKMLQVPATVGTQSLYKFTTEDGKTVFLGLEMKQAPRPGTRYFTLETAQGKLTAGKDFNIVELYRYNDAKNEWLRNNVLFVETGKAADPLPITVSPDGAFNVGQTVQA